jgi:hypothetical protein
MLTVVTFSRISRQTGYYTSWRRFTDSNIKEIKISIFLYMLRQTWRNTKFKMGTAYRDTSVFTMPCSMSARGKAGGPRCLLLSGNAQERKCCLRIRVIGLFIRPKCHKYRIWRNVYKCFQLNREWSQIASSYFLCKKVAKEKPAKPIFITFPILIDSFNEGFH